MDTNNNDLTRTGRRSNRPSAVNPNDAPMKPWEVVAELEYLIGTDDATSLARRLGYASHRTLMRALEREDRPDLAHRLARTVTLSSDGDTAATQLGIPSPVPRSLVKPSERRRQVAA